MSMSMCQCVYETPHLHVIRICRIFVCPIDTLTHWHWQTEMSMSMCPCVYETLHLHKRDIQIMSMSMCQCVYVTPYLLVFHIYIYGVVIATWGENEALFICKLDENLHRFLHCWNYGVVIATWAKISMRVSDYNECCNDF